MDRDLVERAMHGDEEAFDELVGRIVEETRALAESATFELT
jgi:hypothetical protein